MSASPTPTEVERLHLLADQLRSIALNEPHLTGSERASLILASQLVCRVCDQQVGAPVDGI